MYDGQVQASFEGFDYVLSDAGCATLAGYDASGDATTVVVKNDRASSDAALESGLAFTKLTMHMERMGEELSWTFTLSPEITLTGLKLPASETNHDEGDMDSAMLERLYLMEQVVGVVHQVFKIQ